VTLPSDPLPPTYITEDTAAATICFVEDFIMEDNMGEPLQLSGWSCIALQLPGSPGVFFSFLRHCGFLGRLKIIVGV
jgi:hypothetical protein